MDAETIKSKLECDMDVLVLGEVTSTNDVAASIGRGVVFAEMQTAGRGRQGRSFYSGRGGLYFSLAFPVENGFMTIGSETVPFSAGRMTISAGIAVCKTLLSLGFDAVIKWVNDVYVGGKKVCGILAEMCGDVAVLGIGINLASVIPSELDSKAASLSSSADPCSVGAAVINEFMRLVQSPDIDFLRSRCMTIGKTVVTRYGIGRAVDVDENGALIVDIGGERVTVFTGEAETV